MQFPVDKYEQLVDSILAGEVVFFVGAGFSRDSEGNTAQRLIARLLARFMAMVEYVNEKNVATEDFCLGLKRTFQLKDKDEILSQAVIDKLAERYFDINDWIISAFEALLTSLKGVRGARADLWERINPRENAFLSACPLNSKHDAVKLTAMEPYVLDGKLSARDRGKALFLDTMGFREPSIMAGEPADEDFQRVMADYLGIIRDRHRALARLAREGLCPLLLTTNYDLLLEGAFRLAGFEVPPFSGRSDNGIEAAGTPRGKPHATFDRLYRVGAPVDFFERGAAFRSALLVKIHGCANRYGWSAHCRPGRTICHRSYSPTARYRTGGRTRGRAISSRRCCARARWCSAATAASIPSSTTRSGPFTKKSALNTLSGCVRARPPAHALSSRAAQSCASSTVSRFCVRRAARRASRVRS